MSKWRRQTSVIVEALLDPLKQMVRDFGVLSVLTAHHSEDGLAQLCEKPLGMVIGDYGLTPANGLEFARRQNVNPKPVIWPRANA